MYFGDSGGTAWWAAEEVVENEEMVDGDGRRALHATEAGMVVGGVARREEVEGESTPLSDGRGRWGGIVVCRVRFCPREGRRGWEGTELAMRVGLFWVAGSSCWESKLGKF